MNFHSLVQGTQQVRGPYPTRPDAEEAWKAICQEFRHKANYRFTIVQDAVRRKRGGLEHLRYVVKPANDDAGQA